MKLLLASNSPRRKQLLSLAGWSFSVLPAEINESPWVGENPQAYVLRLAETKARAVGRKAEAPSLVVAADTTVADGAVILGKPDGVEDAAAMLRRLCGRTHQVFTALSVLRVADSALFSEICTTSVTMRNYSEAEMDAYIATGDPLDKAGAYAIQHTGFNPVESLEGCYANVVGLPLCRLVRILKGLGLQPPRGLPYACLYSFQETCSIPSGLVR